MKNLRQVFLGILIALASFGLIIGAFSLSLAEGTNPTVPAPTQPMVQSSTPTLPPLKPSANSPTHLATLTSTLTFTSTPTLTPSLPASPTKCFPPPGWSTYIVQSGDTFAKLATRQRTSSSELQKANCLPTTGLLPGMVIYVPPVPVQTPVPCGPPHTWIIHIVQPGENLYRLSLAYAIGIPELQQANCMGNSTLLQTGQRFYVPPWAPISSPTASAVATQTLTPTNTPDSGLPSDTPTEVPTSISTDTPVPIPSDTPVEIPTDTPATP
jgi:LysM repeat protein